jgi:DNA-binding transcriptional LysR family regulator
MKTRRPSFRQLEALIAVMETGSITHAAERMNVSQPALSRLVSSLELDLGYPMFRRAGGRVVPTSEAEMLREEIQNALGAVDRACRRARQLGSMDEGRLTVCAFPSFAATAFSRLLARFSAQHPGITVTLNAMHAQRSLDEVALQRADFAVSDLPGRANGVLAEHLCRYHAVCVVRSDHQFAGRAHVSLDALAKERFVSLGEEDEARITVHRAFLTQRIDLAWKAEVSLCASACAWVAAVGGCAIVDPFSIQDWQGQLVSLSTDPPIPFDLWLLRSDVKPLTRVASACLEQLRRYTATLPGVRPATAGTASKPTPIRRKHASSSQRRRGVSRSAATRT